MNTNLKFQPFATASTRFIGVMAYTIVLLITLLQSSAQPIVGPAMPPGPVPLEREIALTMAHFTGFSLLTIFWWFALSAILPFSRALMIACIIAICLSFSTEMLQTFVPDRGASWWDIGTNGTAILVSASLIFRRYKH